MYNRFLWLGPFSDPTQELLVRRACLFLLVREHAKSINKINKIFIIDSQLIDLTV